MKKLLATFVIGAVSITSVLGFAACGGDKNSDVPKSEKVTEEEWRAAITATIDADNFTMIESYYSTTKTIKDENGQDVIRAESSTKSTETYLADGKLYCKQTENSKMIRNEDVRERKTTNESYTLVESLNHWYARCMYTEYIQGYPEDYENGTPEWMAMKYGHTDENAAKNDLKERTIKGQLRKRFFTDKDGTEAKEVFDMYSAFTYSDGKYISILYTEGIEAKVEVCIKNGYVAWFGCSFSCEGDGPIYSYIKEEMSYAVVFKDCGSTIVTAPEGAIAAIDKVKAEGNK